MNEVRDQGFLWASSSEWICGDGRGDTTRRGRNVGRIGTMVEFLGIGGLGACWRACVHTERKVGVGEMMIMIMIMMVVEGEGRLQGKTLWFGGGGIRFWH